MTPAERIARLRALIRECLVEQRMAIVLAMLATLVWVIAAWKKLPLPVANILGPPLVRGLG